MVLHFENVFEGYITMVVAPLPRHFLEQIPVSEQVSGRGFRPDEIAQMPVSGAFKFESVTPRRRAPAGQEPELPELEDRPARPPRLADLQVVRRTRTR